MDKLVNGEFSVTNQAAQEAGIEGLMVGDRESRGEFRGQDTAMSREPVTSD